MDSEKAIKANDTNYGNFSRFASEVYLIPSLQRPYSWGSKQVEKLWCDLLENKSGYYIGSIVAVASRGSADRDLIIDGQQRLTTLSLFLIAIRDYISNKGEQSFVDIQEEILEMLIRPRHKNPGQIRLSFSNENSNAVYCAMVRGESLSPFETDVQKKFIKNLDFIKGKLKAYSPECLLENISDLLERIRQSQLIFISCTDKSAAYKLFESINATGVSLASTDMIKNSIFDSLQKKPEELRFVEDGWREMYEVFNEDSGALKTYIRHHWISTVAYTGHSRLFDDFLDQYKSPEEVLNYAKSLFASAGAYQSLRVALVEGLSKISKVRYEINEIRETLEFLSFLSVDQVYSVLLFSYEKDPKNFKKDLIRFAAFSFLYKFVPGSPSIPEKKYFADFCTGKITREKVISGLVGLCEGQSVQFKKKLVEKIKYVGGRSGDIQFVLEKFLFYKGGPSKFEKPTIEHIIPQSVSADECKKFEGGEKVALKMIHSLGNLTILENRINSSDDIGSRPFAEKKLFYRDDLFEGNRRIVDYDFESDPAAAITLRGDSLAEDIYKIFMDALITGSWRKREEDSEASKKNEEGVGLIR